MQKPIKQKRCPVCLEMYTPKRYGLRLTRCCENAGCRLDYAQGVRAKEAAKEAKQQKKTFLDNDKSFQRAKAQKVFNEYIRLRDEKDGCISCDKPHDWNGQWHASHWKSRGARPDLAFNEDNVHKACSICNKWLSGNASKFKDALLIKIGEARVAELEKDMSKVKLSASDYSEIYKAYKLKIKNLKSLNN